MTPTMMLPRFGRLRLTDGAVPSIITGFSTLAGLPEASVTVSRPVYVPSGGAAASASGRSAAFAHGTLYVKSHARSSRAVAGPTVSSALRIPVLSVAP